MKQKTLRSNRIWSIVMTIVCVIYMYPIFMVLMNSLKVESAISTSTAFDLPNAETFAGLANYENAIGSQGFLLSLFYTAFITITSVLAILIFCSMFAWYITRVNNRFTKILYLLCAFSMVVPFQMVMFTLSSLADTLHLNTPWVLWIIYLGFGAGLAVFMFCGFMRSVPLAEMDFPPVWMATEALAVRVCICVVCATTRSLYASRSKPGAGRGMSVRCTDEDDLHPTTRRDKLSKAPASREKHFIRWYVS